MNAVRGLETRKLVGTSTPRGRALDFLARLTDKLTLEGASPSGLPDANTEEGEWLKGQRVMHQFAHKMRQVEDGQVRLLEMYAYTM